MNDENYDYEARREEEAAEREREAIASAKVLCWAIAAASIAGIYFLVRLAVAAFFA